jgi:hypothetical protein
MANRVKRTYVQCGACVDYLVDVSIKENDWEEYYERKKTYDQMKSAGIREGKAFRDSGIGKFIEDRFCEVRDRRATKITDFTTLDFVFWEDEYIFGWKPSAWG